MNYRELFKKYIKETEEGKTHAVLSASGSERWLGCPGSVRLSEGLVQVDNPHSIRGTNTHTLMQFILENLAVWKTALASPAANAFKAHIDFDDDMLESARFAVEYVLKEKARMKRENGITPKLFIERKVKLKGVGHGTADAILYQPYGLLHVMDFKNGRSVVEPEDNTQGLYYAVATADELGWNFDDLWITIIQPNAKHKNGGVRTWKTTEARLKQERKRFLLGAKITKGRNAPLVVNDKWCWFCIAREKCPKQQAKKTAKILNRFARDLNDE